MGEVGGDAGLVEEHAQELRLVREVRVDPLEHDLPAEAARPHLRGQEHLGHPADGDPARNLVSANQKGRLDTRPLTRIAIGQ